MIVGLGVDVVDHRRFRRVLARHGARFLQRCFAAAELAAAGTGRARLGHLAARWAAKEAAMKALGVPRGAKFTDYQILGGPDEPPELQLSGPAAACAKRRGVTRWLVSLSHERELSVAVVIAEAQGKRK